MAGIAQHIPAQQKHYYTKVVLYHCAPLALASRATTSIRKTAGEEQHHKKDPSRKILLLPSSHIRTHQQYQITVLCNTKPRCFAPLK